MTPDGDFDIVAAYDGWPNGLKVHPDGTLRVADYKRGIMRIDPASGSVEPLVDHRWSESFRGCNDLHIALDGAIYFTDQGQTGMHDPTGRVYRLTPDGRLQLLVGTVPSPNGLVPSLDETLLYVAVTRGNAVWRLPLLPDGSTTKVSIFIQLSGGHGGPDGMALDAEGGLLVCHAGLGTVWHFDHPRPAAAPDPFPSRPDDHQRRLRRTGQPLALHHRIGIRHGAPGRASGPGPGHGLARLNARFLPLTFANGTSTCGPRSTTRAMITCSGRRAGACRGSPTTTLMAEPARRWACAATARRLMR